MPENYDINDPKSIVQYGQGLIGRTFRDVLKLPSPFSDPRGGRGNLGVILEEHYFGYRANSDQRPDLGEVELKSTPCEITKAGGIRAGERLVLTMIDYRAPVIYDFYKTHLWSKCRLLLLVVYCRDPHLKNSLDYIIRFVQLFRPPEVDMQIILEDYRFIIDCIADGRAHELSESQTKYLGACTKGSTAKDSIREQFYPHKGVKYKAKRRAFCFKQPYMTYVLNNYIDVKHDESESIVKSSAELEVESFENIVEQKLERNLYRYDHEIARAFKIRNRPKNFWSMLTFAMLGVKTNNAAEFLKAGITVKTIRVEADNSIREDMSFPAINLRRFANDEWEDSEIYGRFGMTRYLFVVFKKVGKGYRLEGCRFWSMPNSDLQNEVLRAWEAYRSEIRKGVTFIKSKGLSKKGNPIIFNSLPKKTDNKIIHLRPHTTNAYYKLNDGTCIGNVRDGDILPNGEWMTKQGVWLNKEYVFKQISYLIK